MTRAFHRWPGLLALVLVIILSLSGAALSVFPATERIAAPQAPADLNVATLAERILLNYPGLEQIRRTPSGQITAYWFDYGKPGAAVIDPVTGQGVASADPNQIKRWLTNLHRSLFLGDSGRIAMAAGAMSMLFLSISGMVLVVRRIGGWKRWFSPLRGARSGRLHVEIARITVFGLFLSSTTALWMAASTFDLLPDVGNVPAFPAQVSGQSGVSLGSVDILLQTQVTELRELSFPYPSDTTDVFTLKTDRGTGYIDQGTGTLLVWTPLTTGERVTETIYMLHTGQGAPVLGVFLGLMVLGVPAMGVTGFLIWRSGRRNRPCIRNNQSVGRAETILLVGSEGGTTWGFAASLHAMLTQIGQKVHTAAMSNFAPQKYTHAKRIIILTATYGNGDAPASAKRFLNRLAQLDKVPDIPLAVLGFGDRSFPAYCAFAKTVAHAAQAKGWPMLLPLDTINRQSPQDFARWGNDLGQAIGTPLKLSHEPILPVTTMLTLVSRRDYGAEVQAPSVILRFARPRATFWQHLTGTGFARFDAGDLIGVLPNGSPVPRFYSLASAHSDGFIEIVVKKHTGGIASTQLTALKPGDSIPAFLHRNPDFHPGAGHTPLILIGAGTGIGPLAGFVRGNIRQRPVHLFFGMRHPDSDFFYDREIPLWQTQGRLTRLVTAISRGAHPHYVQDALRNDAAQVTQLIRDGARVMVCGGRDMAAGVADTLDEILAPTGFTPAKLKAEGRYFEDVY